MFTPFLLNRETTFLVLYLWIQELFPKFAFEL